MISGTILYVSTYNIMCTSTKKRAHVLYSVQYCALSLVLVCTGTCKLICIYEYENMYSYYILVCIRTSTYPYSMYSYVNEYFYCVL